MVQLDNLKMFVIQNMSRVPHSAFLQDVLGLCVLPTSSTSTGDRRWDWDGGWLVHTEAVYQQGHLLLVVLIPLVVEFLPLL